MVETTMQRGYEVGEPSPRHPTGGLRAGTGIALALFVAGAVALSVVTRAWPIPVALAAVAGTVTRRPAPAALVLVVAGAGLWRSEASWASLEPDELGSFRGWATVVDEPRRSGAATRVLLEVEGERFEVWVRGRAGQGRVATWRGGDRVVVAGERRALDPARVARVSWQHVVGELEPTWLGDVRAGGHLATASNRVRNLIERGAAHLPADQAALTRGLVIGDDRDQPPEMVERFRDSGLSHLTAVSGQNVSYVLAAAGPLLARARPWLRWAATVALIAWFVVLTRAEPSILRAGAMAAVSATAFVLGRQREPVRLLALAVTALLLVDPLLAWSVGFWLSVGATAGVTVLGPPLARRLHVLGPLALPAGITIGAQAGVALPSVLVFGRLSLVGTFANLLAVPVAGLVMLVGLPACLLAGVVPALAAALVGPVGLGVRWIDAVATVGAAVEPEAPWSAVGWLVVGAVVVTLVVLGDRRRRVRQWPAHDGAPADRRGGVDPAGGGDRTRAPARPGR